MILASLWLIGIFGPLLAMKAGLTALEKTRDGLTIKAVAATFSPSQNAAGRIWMHLRDMPALVLAMGIIGAWVAACILGLAAFAIVGFGLGQTYGFWAQWSRVICALAAAAVLYFPDIKLCGLKSILSIDTFIIAAVSLLAAFMAWLPGLGMEIAGFAFLTHAFFLIDRRRDCPDCDRHKNEPWSNPKPWLLLGLLGLCGTVAAADQIGRAALCAVCGTGLGALSILAREGLFPHARPQAEQSPS